MRTSPKHLPCQSLDALQSASREALLETWRGLMGRPPPKSISRPLLLALLAFELQERESPETGLGKSFLKALAQAASHTQPRPKLRPGGRLVRDWHGRSYIVDVTDQGYLFDGKTYTSLTKIAAQITGTHQSGPRFFGVAQ